MTGGRGPSGHPARRAAGLKGQGSSSTGAQVAVFQLEGYSGPTPHPATIEGYQAAIPNGGERLMALVESEQEHRHTMDKRNLRAGLTAHLVGMTFGFVIALAVIYVGYLLVKHNHDVAGYTALLAGASGLIASVYVGVRKTPPTE